MRPVETMTSTYPVEVMRVSRTFESNTVLSDISFELASGDIRGLIGPNGAGKTTLLRIIAGLVEPSSGHVSVLGGAPTDDEVRRRVGWIPGGDRTFYLRLSGRANLVFFGRMYGLSRREAARKAVDLLEQVGLAEAGERATGLYSKGMLKRLAVARSLIADPVVLLCDETTHDLDPEGAKAIRALVGDLAQHGMAVVWATQRLDELASFANTVTVLSKSGVAYSGDMDGLLERLERRTFIVSVGIADANQAVEVLGGRDGVDARLVGGALQVTLDADFTVGALVMALDAAGMPVTSISEVGSQVEAAYESVLGGGGVNHGGGGVNQHGGGGAGNHGGGEVTDEEEETAP